MTPRQIVALYFLTQAIGTLSWWGLLIGFPPSIKWFQPSDWPADALLSFWMADLILIVAGSLTAAVGAWRQYHWATNVVRPVEERDLVERFGESYDHYRKSVRLWLPRITAPQLKNATWVGRDQSQS